MNEVRDWRYGETLQRERRRTWFGAGYARIEAQDSKVVENEIETTGTKSCAGMVSKREEMMAEEHNG